MSDDGHNYAAHKKDKVQAWLQRHPRWTLHFADLTTALNDETVQAEAAEALRTLIDEVRLVPTDGKLNIELYGELAALINLGAKTNPQVKDPGVQVTLVAGALHAVG